MEYTTSQAIADSLLIYGIVIVVSLLVAVVIRLIVWTLSRKAAQVTDKAPAAAAPKPAAPATAHGLPQDHFAAIAAAVAAMMGAHRIVRIETASQSYTWTAATRTAHHLSRAPRR